MIVVCEHAGHCKNKKCDHRVSHEESMISECSKRYCEYAGTNVECTDTFTENIINKIKRRWRRRLNSLPNEV
jgi:hypothetical protein